jgi:hypothetical protein
VDLQVCLKQRERADYTRETCDRYRVIDIAASGSDAQPLPDSKDKGQGRCENSPGGIFLKLARLAGLAMAELLLHMPASAAEHAPEATETR